jgi:hypothetical protein
MNTENGLNLKTTWNDDPGESKTFTGIVDSSAVTPVECSVNIRVGYDIDHFFGLRRGKTMKEKQKTFNEISPQYTVKNLTEFKNAVIDGAIIIEQKRMADVNVVISECDISTGDTPQKRELWGLAQKYLRQKRPQLHIFLDRNQHERVYIMGSRAGEWCWGGFSDVSKIDFNELYKNLLRTEQHAKNLDGLCNAIVGAI